MDKNEVLQALDNGGGELPEPYLGIWLEYVNTKMKFKDMLAKMVVQGLDYAVHSNTALETFKSDNLKLLKQIDELKIAIDNLMGSLTLAEKQLKLKDAAIKELTDKGTDALVKAREERIQELNIAIERQAIMLRDAKATAENMQKMLKEADEAKQKAVSANFKYDSELRKVTDKFNLACNSAEEMEKRLKLQIEELAAENFKLKKDAEKLEQYKKDASEALNNVLHENERLNYVISEDARVYKALANEKNRLEAGLKFRIHVLNAENEELERNYLRTNRLLKDEQAKSKPKDVESKMYDKYGKEISVINCRSCGKQIKYYYNGCATPVYCGVCAEKPNHICEKCHQMFRDDVNGNNVYVCNSCRAREGAVEAIAPEIPSLMHKKHLCINCGSEFYGDTMVCGACMLGRF